MEKPNACGDCYGCCKVLAIDDLGDEVKPVNQLCAHFCKGVGCAIYEKRPPSCSRYQCLWLESKEAGREADIEFRPDRCGVLIDGLGNKWLEGYPVATARLLWPGALENPDAIFLIERAAAAGYIVVVSDGQDILCAAVPASSGLTGLDAQVERKAPSIPLEREVDLHV